MESIPVTFTVKYQIATYRGTVKVKGSDCLSEDKVIAMAKKQLRQRAGEFPLGYQSWKIVDVRK